MDSRTLVLAAILSSVPPAMGLPNKGSPVLELSQKAPNIGLPDGIGVKHDVILRGLNEKMLPVFHKAPNIWRKYGKNLVITSGLDGKHCKGSRHYAGLALDLRSLNLKRNARAQVRSELAVALGDGFRVLMENDHIHVEYNALQNTGLQNTISHPALTSRLGDIVKLAKGTP
jgi:hypothetical protein